MSWYNKGCIYLKIGQKTITIFSYSIGCPDRFLRIIAEALDKLKPESRLRMNFEDYNRYLDDFWTVKMFELGRFNNGKPKYEIQVCNGHYVNRFSNWIHEAIIDQDGEVEIKAYKIEASLKKFLEEHPLDAIS